MNHPASRGPLPGPLTALALAGLLAAACEVTGTVSPSGQLAPGADAGRVLSVRLEPAEATLRIVDDAPAQQAFRVFATYAGGRELELDPARVPVAFRLLDPTLGRFDGDTLVTYTGFGGRTQVEARIDDVAGYADVVVELERVEPLAVEGAAALPDDPEAVFAAAAAVGADPGRAPAIVYPTDGVVLPPNLGSVEVHATTGDPAHTLFELAFANAATDVRFHARCTRPEGVGGEGQCVWNLDGLLWEYFARTNRGGEPLSLRVRATDDEGTVLGESPPVSMRFARDDIVGTLYYWTTSDLPPPLDGPSVLRFDFADPDAVIEPMITESQAGRCVGCHAVSRDGTKVFASVGGQNAGGVMIRDLEVDLGEEGDFLWRAPDERILQFASFSPDGSELVGVYGERDLYEDPDGAGNGGDLIFFRTECDDVPDGCVIGRADLGGREASHPDWGPTGDLIAFTDVGIGNTSQRPYFGGISYVERDGDGWGPPVERIPRADGRNRYNPTLSPVDGAIVAYNESTCPGGDLQQRDCNADTDPSAKVWAAVTRGDAPPVLLAAAMGPGPLDEDDDLANTFPRFAPFRFVLEAGEIGDRTILWLTFSSTRNLGFRQPPEGVNTETDRGTFLWMVAIEPERLAQGLDPSSAPFALPFQELDTSNHIGVWTEQAVGDPILR